MRESNLTNIKSVQIMIDRTLPLVESWIEYGANHFDRYLMWAKKEKDYTSRELYDSIIKDKIWGIYDDTIMIQSILAADFSDDPLIKQGYLNTAEYIFMEHDSKFGGLEFGAVKLNAPIIRHDIESIKSWIVETCYLGIDPIPLIKERFPEINWVVTELHYPDKDYKYPKYRLDEKPIIIIEQYSLDVELIVCVPKGDDRSGEYHTARNRLGK